MRRLPLLVALLALAACDVNPFDETQQPSVRVDAGAPPVFSWTPQGAWYLQVFEGADVTDAVDGRIMWAVYARVGENSVRSPVTYGVEPEGGEVNQGPLPLVPGQAYTVYVRRGDPRGSGDGFTNTRNDYSDAATFVAE